MFLVKKKHLLISLRSELGPFHNFRDLYGEITNPSTCMTLPISVREMILQDRSYVDPCPPGCLRRHSIQVDLAGMAYCQGTRGSAGYRGWAYALLALCLLLLGAWILALCACLYM